jgi:hypothetical protein
MLQCLTQEVQGRTNRLFSFHTTRTAQKMMPPAVPYCSEYIFAELLPVNDIQTERPTDSPLLRHGRHRK